MATHKTTTIHSEIDNKFVAKVIEFEKYWQQELAEGKIFKFPKKGGDVEFSEEIIKEK